MKTPHVLSTVLLVAGMACSEKTPSPQVASAEGPPAMDVRALQVRTQWVAGIDSLQSSLSRFERSLHQLDQTPDRVVAAQSEFRAARVEFKKIEYLTAYYEPSTAATMNGPALPRVEAQEGPEAVFPPEGFQVIEETLFAAAEEIDTTVALRETHNLQALTRRLRATASTQRVTDNRVWDAVRLEIARVATLGITGFDSPIAQLSLAEASAALRGVHAALTPYGVTSGIPQAWWPGLDQRLRDAVADLDAPTALDEYDRMQFIVAHANPLAHAVDRARSALGLVPPEERRAFRITTASLFDSAAIDASAFASPGSEPDTPVRVELGRRLFFEPMLSGDGTQSCGSCHEPARAFTDGRARSASRVGTRAGIMRNTPTVINAGVQNAMFADQRTAYLEDQVAAVLGSADEMHSDAAVVTSRLARDTAYRHAFAGAFGAQGDSAVTGDRLRKVVAAYVRSLMGVNSRIDRALRGDTAGLTAEERLGFNVFAGKGKCATCHFIPAFNGAVPPTYRSSDVEVLGVPATPRVRGATVDPDSGRFHVTRAEPHLFAFKTPGIRNAALTAPYMHNGVYRTLEEVVDFYDRGGGAGIGIDLPNQTLPRTPLRLTAAERRALVAMMRALTDTAGLARRD